MKQGQVELCWEQLQTESPALSMLYEVVDGFSREDCTIAQRFNEGNGTGYPYFNCAAITIMLLLVEAGEQIWWPEEDKTVTLIMNSEFVGDGVSQ